MAKRRKFLAGVGSLAAGSAAAMGTGAFNFANVERDVAIDVVNDSDAFLALKDTSDYADDSDGTLKLTFNSEATTEGGGTGINENSDYSFRGVFSIENRGSHSVGVWINDDDMNDMVSFYAPPEFSNSIEGSGNAYALDPGDSVSVNVVILTRNNDGELPETINVVADRSAGN